MSDRLTPIPVAQLGELKDLLFTDFPSHLGGYGLIANLEEWYRNTPVIEHIQVFSLNDNWRDDGLFVVTVSELFVHLSSIHPSLPVSSFQDRCDLFLYSMIENNARLQRAMKLIDWSRSWRIVNLDSRSSADVLTALAELNVTWDYNLPFDNLYCPAERAINITYSIPEDVTVRRLTPAETDTVNDLWTYRHPGSAVGVRRLIERNYCVGAYDKASGQLLGWCLTFISQCHNALQIEPQFMGRGLGKLIVAKLAHERALQSKWSQGYVSPVNDISQNLFRSFGFERIGLSYWIGTRPREEHGRGAL